MFRVNKKLKQRVPFAVIGSNCVLQINDRRIRARQYPWVSRRDLRSAYFQVKFDLSDQFLKEIQIDRSLIETCYYIMAVLKHDNYQSLIGADTWLRRYE